MKIKKGPGIILGILVVGLGLYFGRPFLLAHLPSNFLKSIGVSKVVMPDIKDATIKNVTPVAFPSTSAAETSATLFRGGIWEWNAQNGLIFSNGGKATTKGSLMEKYGVNLSLERQDDTGKMGEGLVACAKELKDGAKQCSTGYNFVVIMTGGVPQFAATWNAQLLKLGKEYGLKAIEVVGRSAGEDGFWAPDTLKKNPHSIASTLMEGSHDSTPAQSPVTGLLVGGVIRDDDWNIALKWEGDNSLKNNTDEKTFDPDAVNWINEPDYNTAAADYVSGNKCEDRVLMKDGKPTGTKVHVCMNGVVTWTPGDVTLATKRGGLVRIASSKQYLMGAVVLGPGKFFADNRDETAKFIAASLAGGDQVRAYDLALRQAARIAVDVYNGDQGDDSSKDGSYWYKYSKGVTQSDAKGVSVELGGSAVYGMDDNLNFFGINPGQNDNFRTIYGVFSAIDLQQYPQLFTPKTTPIPPVSDVELKSYLRDAQDVVANADGGSSAPIAAASTVDYSKGTGGTVSHRSYNITFGTGSAVPTPEGEQVLSQLMDGVVITTLKIKLDGYTDSSGSSAVNTPLSATRAQAVKNWLQRKSPSNFPNNRFLSVQGHGPDNPVADNSTPQGKAANRRVDLTLVD